MLTNLCTYEGHIPQGAPTSAYISNLVMRDFDEEIGYWCEKLNIDYTRYSDNMTFSGEFEPSTIIKLVRQKLKSKGLELNNEKICVISNSNRQSVTGIVVNNRLNVSSSYRKKIRQEIYFIKKYGLKSHINRICSDLNEKEYILSLFGRILFVLQIDKGNKEFLKYKDFVKEML